MYLRSYLLVFSVVISLGLKESFAEDSKKSGGSRGWQSAGKDELYIDDDDAEGSGIREGKYDMEASGSGFGPDDEDGDDAETPGNGNGTISMIPPTNNTHGDKPPLTTNSTIIENAFSSSSDELLNQARSKLLEYQIEVMKELAAQMKEEALHRSKVRALEIQKIKLEMLLSIKELKKKRLEISALEMNLRIRKPYE